VRRADHSPREIIPNLVCLSLIVKPEKQVGPAPLGAVAQ
jgi:hypothetical protein